MAIQLPQNFTDDHKQIARRFMQGDTFSRQERILLMDAFDILHRATVVMADEQQSFAAFYAQTVEARFAQQYLRALQQAPRVAAVAEELRAQVSRQIMSMLKASGILTPDDPLSFYLLAYCLYWWYAFARGYAFEIEVFQDLDAAGVRYVAHDVLDVQSRRSPFDLIVLGFRGDIKTSTYFFDAVRTSGLLHDFYIARLMEQRKQLWVVFLEEAFWAMIDDEKQILRFAAAAELGSILPGAFRLQLNTKTLIVLDYEAWKRLVLNVQRKV